MYKILQITEWSFLVGSEVIQVAIGIHDVQIVLWKGKDVKGPRISIWCDFEHSRAGQILSNASEMYVKAATLVSVLGKTIDSVVADGEEALIIGFSGGETLSIIVDDAPYECIAVDGPEGLIVV